MAPIFGKLSSERALEWAKKNEKCKKPAVIGAIIKLGNCLDLLDSEHTETVKTAHHVLLAELNQLGEPIPENKSIDSNKYQF